MYFESTDNIELVKQYFNERAAINKHSSFLYGPVVLPSNL